MCLVLAGCGGGGGADNDTTAPANLSVTIKMGNNGQPELSATATDNTKVTAYCFKTTSSTPLASDACFRATQSNTVTLPQISAIYVWARDAAGNISERVPVGCSSTGLSAARASTLPAVCVLTSMGEFVLELETNKAPITTANFLKYVNDGFYGQTVFHRVIHNFMVQAGGFTGVPISQSNAKVSTVYPAITLETSATTGLSNVAGTIAMARTNVLNSATNQFFINVVDNIFLNTSGGGYAVFGRVISGMDSTITSIRNVPVQSNGTEISQPLTPPSIVWAYQIQ